MDDIPSRLATLSPKKRELMLKQLKKRGKIPTSESVSQIPPIIPVSRKQPLPLSFAQQQVWRMEQSFPHNTAHNMFHAMRLLGCLDVAILKQCFHEIIRRHESLQTTIAIRDQQVVQEIARNLVFSLPIVDLRAFSEEKQVLHILELMRAEAARPFDLVRGPCIRGVLLWSADEDHVLMLNLHQIVGDEWSIQILFREMATLYEAFSEGKNSPLPELSFQYADFAVWQRKRLQNESVQKKLAYWKKQLAGLSILNLPTDRPRQVNQTFRAAQRMVEIAQPLLEELRNVSRREKITLFMTMLTAFKVLLHHYSGQNDLVAGTRVTGRSPREMEECIGLFANNLVLRTDFSNDPTFRELLARVRKTVLQAYAHQDIPFEVLLDQVDVKRDSRRSPFFQVMFVLQNFPIANVFFTEIDVTPFVLERSSFVFDIDLMLQERRKGLSGFITYNTDLFYTETIVRMVKQYKTLLKHITATPELRLSQLSFVIEECDK